MALTYYTFQKHEELLDDELIQEAMDDLANIRMKVADWVEDNKPRKACPVCSSESIRYEWDARLCNDCGWREHIDVPYKGKMSISKKLNSLIKQHFGRSLAQKKRDELMKESEIKNVPIDLENFDTGEYTNEQVEFLTNRFKEILSTPDTDFNKKDIATIHFMVLQEMKIKDLFRREAISNATATDKDFAQIKKNEIRLYNDLKDDLNEIIEEQKTDDTEMSLYDKVTERFENKTLEEILEKYESNKERDKELLEKSQERRNKTLSGMVDIEEEIEDFIEGDENE